MRGIRFIKHLCKKFGLHIVNGCGFGGYYFYHLANENGIGFYIYLL